MVAWAEAESLDYFALKVEPGKERMAEDILGNRHILAKLAKRTYETTVKVNRRVPEKVKRETLLLPGIVFVAFPKNEPIPWFALRQRLHIIRGVIGTNNIPDRIRDYEKLLRLFDDIVFTTVQVAAFQRVYTKGERVKIVDGGFAGHIAVVDDVVEEHMDLLCQIFGREVRVRVDAKQFDMVEPVATAAA